MEKEQILEFIKNWITEQALHSDHVTPFENALSIITGFTENFRGYDGQEEDLEKLITEIQKYPKLDISFFGHVLNDNRPWNFEKLNY